MVPAARVAEDLHLNRKTVQRHYRLLRQAISSRSEQGDGGCSLGAAVGKSATQRSRPREKGEDASAMSASPVFGLVLKKNHVRIDFCGLGSCRVAGKSRPLETAALCFAGSDQTLKAQNLADFYWALPEHGEEPSLEQDFMDEIIKFWDFARRLKDLYRGRRQKSLQLFLREAEFRYNNRDNPEVIKLLVGLLNTCDR